ncbi:MAG: NAD(P)H-dependent oxidoreductase [Bacteroidales bacterium]|nr:NAD(P)H-dependent oxidoreductase [Bacteroidales bacterium]
MKQILMMAATLLFAVSCGANKDSKALVLYYSQGGTTKAVAEAIQTAIGADIEEIVPVDPYDPDFNATIARGQKEMSEGKFPELQPLKADVRDYDVIFIGYPVWFGTYANPIETLIATVDFSGKKVVPFCTFGSGGLDTSEKALREKLPNATVLPGYGVRAARIAAAPAEVENFLKANDFLAGEYVKPAEFPAPHAVSEEESAIFDTAVGTYPMIRAKAAEVAERDVPGGKEYLFSAEERGGTIKVLVLAEEGKDPVFTQVLR